MKTAWFTRFTYVNNQIHQVFLCFYTSGFARALEYEIARNSKIDAVCVHLLKSVSTSADATIK